MDELLLDTTYLLPIFGAGTNLKGFAETFPTLLETYAVVYTPVSLVEAKWVLIRLARMGKAPKEELFLSYRKGLRALQSETRMGPSLLTEDAVEEISDQLSTDGTLPDYFDRMIYATAVVRGSILLTEDEKMHQLALREEGPRPKATKTWSRIFAELN